MKRLWFAALVISGVSILVCIWSQVFLQLERNARGVDLNCKGGDAGAVLGCALVLNSANRLAYCCARCGLVSLVQRRARVASALTRRVTAPRASTQGLTPGDAGGLDAADQPDETEGVLDDRAVPNAQPAAEQEEDATPLLLRRLPLYATLLGAIALALVFTGSWLAVQDLKELERAQVFSEHRTAVRHVARHITTRRYIAIAGAAGLFILWLLKRQMPAFAGIIVLVFFLDSLGRAGRTRTLIEQVRQRRS